MDFKKGEVLSFEEILVKVVEINIDSVVFEVLSSGYEEDEGDLMEVPNWYLKANQDELKR
ncbi:hypothetical protein GLW07_08900 [Bacillus hwajinpoensis]|uniref:Uncharacterized protein n=1 Tax=Guptibacillus hwajinpoensis TaxID=208199 RepID=A0A845EY64_9BACL|nr:hypothetical protein [Pseudalkalibacillus hwajinpoensis]MYL63469.1 hypothetical protein [Pseudalkalibacillus hwajinpoensis]